MKNINVKVAIGGLLLGLITGTLLSLSNISLASNLIKYIQVPEYIGNYKTLDLLQYMAELKDKETKPVAEVKIEIPKAETQNTESIKKEVPKGIKVGDGRKHSA